MTESKESKFSFDDEEKHILKDRVTKTLSKGGYDSAQAFGHQKRQHMFKSSELVWYGYTGTYTDYTEHMLFGVYETSKEMFKRKREQRRIKDLVSSQFFFPRKRNK